MVEWRLIVLAVLWFSFMAALPQIDQWRWRRKRERQLAQDRLLYPGLADHQIWAIKQGLTPESLWRRGSR